MFIIYHYGYHSVSTVFCTVVHHFVLYFVLYFTTLYCITCTVLYYSICTSLWSMELVSTCHLTEGVYISNSTINQSLTTEFCCQSIIHHQVFRLPVRLLAALHFRYTHHTFGVRISLAIGSTRLILILIHFPINSSRPTPEPFYIFSYERLL